MDGRAEQPAEKVTRSVSEGRWCYKDFEKVVPRSRFGLFQIPFFNRLLIGTVHSEVT